MRRYLYLILFFLVLILPMVTRYLLVGASATPSAAGAVLTVITPHNQDIRREFERAFNAWHQQHYGSPAQIDFRNPGGTEDIRRLLEKTYEGYRDPQTRQLRPDMPADIDVVWGGGDFFLDQQLLPLGILQPIQIDPRRLSEIFPEPTLGGVKLYDLHTDASSKPAPRWIGVCLSAFGIVYNPDLYRTLHMGAPTTWRALRNPKLDGLIALADPAHSGSAAVAYMMVIQRAMADAEEALLARKPELAALSRSDLVASAEYQQAIDQGWQEGMSDLLLIAANARYFTDSASQVPRDVSDGQAAVGVAIDFYGRVTQDVAGPDRCRVVMPKAATAVTPDPVGILYGVKGEKLELANRFVEFLLSREGQRLWILKAGQPKGPANRALRRPPIRRDVYADKTGWADDVDPFADASSFNQRVEWMDLFTETRLLWTAAWIDSRDELKAAYERIMAVKDPKQRNILRAKLAELPVTMAEVAQMKLDRKQARKENRLDDWTARTRMQWAQTFRDHYDRVSRSRVMRNKRTKVAAP